MARNALEGSPGWHPAERILQVREIPRAYERSLSAVKFGVNPGWSCEADTTKRKTAGSGIPAASDQARAAWRRCGSWQSPWREIADTGQVNLPRYQQATAVPWRAAITMPWPVSGTRFRGIREEDIYIDSQPPRICGVAVLLGTQPIAGRHIAVSNPWGSIRLGLAPRDSPHRLGIVRSTTLPCPSGSILSTMNLRPAASTICPSATSSCRNCAGLPSTANVSVACKP